MRIKLLVCFLIISISAGAQTAQLTCNAGGIYNSNFLINNVLQDEGTCNNLNKKINVAVLDSCSFMPWTTDSCIYGYFNQLNYNDCIGNSTCLGHPQPYAYFQFECVDSVQMSGLITLLNNVPAGNHILAFTFSIPPYASCPWPPAMKNTFMSLGSTMFNTISDTVPFIFYVKKGFLSTIHEVSGIYATDTVHLSVTIECLPASVKENIGDNSLISIFPNPAVSQLRIKNPEDPMLKIESVEIYDVVGKKHLTLNPSPLGEGLRIDVSSLQSGMYFARIKTEKGIICKKFIKQ